MKPNKQQINLAAKLYTLSLAANTDQFSDTDEGNIVRKRVEQRAQNALNRLGLHAGELRTDVECLEVAMRLKPYKLN